MQVRGKVRTSPRERNLSNAWLGVGIFYRFSGGFFISGVYKVFRYEKSRDLIPWVKDVPRALAQTIGVAEILGALGLILPVITGIYAWLTPVAAVALALLMLIAAVFHAFRRETTEAGINVLLLIMLAFVAYIRWPLMP